ncbi:MAG: malic enzyme [Naasia sp.]|jgi:hypothetical protein|nr:malic enzyme [Naasia sp.]
MRGSGGVGAALLLPFALAGCAGAAFSEGGLGIPTADLLEPPGVEQELAGTIAVGDNGCFHVDTVDGRLYVIWPAGFEQDAEVVRSPAGGVFGDGAPVTGLASILDADAAVRAADGPDGYIATVTGYCLEDDERIAVYSVLG